MYGFKSKHLLRQTSQIKILTHYVSLATVLYGRRVWFLLGPAETPARAAVAQCNKWSEKRKQRFSPTQLYHWLWPKKIKQEVFLYKKRYAWQKLSLQPLTNIFVYSFLCVYSPIGVNSPVLKRRTEGETSLNVCWNKTTHRHTHTETEPKRIN